MAADGSVVIELRMDISQAEKKLAALTKQIEETEKKLIASGNNEKNVAQDYSTATAELENQRNSAVKIQAEIENLQISEKQAIDVLQEYKNELDSVNLKLKAISNIPLTSPAYEVSKNMVRSKYERQRNEIEARIANTSQNIAFYEDNIGQANEALNRQNALIKESEKNVASLKNTWDEAKLVVSDLTSQLQRQKAEAGALADTKRQEEERIAEIKRQEAELERVAEEAGRAYLESIVKNAEIADQHIIELRNEIETLTARQSELKQAGLGLGYEEYDRIEARLSEINGELSTYRNNLKQSSEAAREAADGVDEMANAGKKAGGFMEKLGSRIFGLAKRVFVFSLITSALRSLRTYLGNAIKANDQANAAFSRLKGALLTLAQPIIEVLIPALTTLANILTVIVSSIARMFSALSGKTAEQSAEAAKGLYDEAEAIEGVGSAAEEAAGSLAGFDEINTIQTENSKGGSAGGGGAAAVPDFTLDSAITDRLKEIADLVMLIAAGLTLWKIGTMLPGVLGTIAAVLGGILMTIGGLLLAWNGLTDAWENGVDWLNLIEMIGGLAAAVFGLYTVFSKISPTLGRIAAGVALVVGGIAMLVTAFHDAMESGWNLQNTFLAIAGLLATGLGFSFITGSVIPLLIAAIASLMLAMTISTGHGEELLDGIRTMIEGFKEFFTGIFTGDMKKAVEGLKKIFSGLKTAVGAVVRGIRDFWLNLLDWLDEKTGGKLHGIIQVIKNYVSSFYKFVENTISAMLDIFSGILQFLSGDFEGGWETVWGGIKDLVSGVVEFINDLIDNVIGAVKDAWDAVVNFVTGAEKKANRAGTFGGQNSGGFSAGGRANISIPPITNFKIPALARGAVIPPNREFMAVLGDQKSGTNVEAPLETIKQALVEALRENGGSANRPINITMMLDRKVIGKAAISEIRDNITINGKLPFPV